jgi:hypothetical protein
MTEIDRRFRICIGVQVLCLVAMLLMGCATPATKIETKEVLTPVAVQPITPDQVPSPPPPLGPRPQSLSAAADVLLAKVCELEAYVLRADPLLRVAAGQPQKELPLYPECERK